MPTRNSIKLYSTQSFYHVYNRGVEKRKVFLDDQDYEVFIAYIKRYIDIKPHRDDKGREFDWLRDQIEINAFCLMPNHFHMLVYLEHEQALTKLMRSVCSAYTVYFNKKYRRVGSLFQGIFKAKHILNESYLEHICRYIHLNPVSYKTWPWSNYCEYIGQRKFRWTQPEKTSEMFSDYAEFTSSYEKRKLEIDELKNELAFL